MKNKKKKWKFHNEWKVGIKQTRKKAQGMDTEKFKRLIDSGLSSTQCVEHFDISIPTLIKYSHELLGFDYYMKMRENGKDNVRAARKLRL